MTVIINLDAYHASRAEAQERVRRLFMPLPQPAEDDPHDHVYSVVLVAQDSGHGFELHEFEAPCPEADAAGNIRAVIAGLREAANQVEAAYADLLDVDGENGTTEPEE